MSALVCLIPSLVLGIVMIWAARRGYREGDAPHCVKCDYNLTALTSERCPECGTELQPKMVAQGERRRPAGLLAMGVVFAVGSLFFIGKITYESMRRDRFWFDIYPTNKLETLTQSSDWRTSGQAWDQLTQRLASGKLGSEQISRVIDLALKTMSKPTVVPQGSNYRGVGSCLVDGGGCQGGSFLWPAVANGHASTAQKEKFFRNWVVGQLLVRTHVRQGDPVPYSMSARLVSISCGGIGFTGLVDRVTIQFDTDLIGSYPVYDDVGSRLTDRCKKSGMLESSRPGKHTVRAIAHIAFYGPRESEDYGEWWLRTPFHSTDIAFEKTLEVVPKPGDSVFPKADPSLKSQIASTVSFGPIHVTDNGIWGFLWIKQPPVSLSFDVLLRVNGQEYPAGKATVAHNDPCWPWPDSMNDAMHFRIGCNCPAPANGTWDVILRSNPDWARETVDVYDMWKGELEFKDCSIKTKR